MTVFAAAASRDLAIIIVVTVLASIVFNLPQIAARIAEWAQ